METIEGGLFLDESTNSQKERVPFKEKLRILLLRAESFLSLFSLIKIRKILILGISFLAMAIVILLLLAYVPGFLNRPSQPAQSSPSPVAQESPRPKKVPSSLAIDPGFATLEGDLQTLEQDLESVDLSEPKLSFPILEIDVNFEE